MGQNQHEEKMAHSRRLNNGVLMPLLGIGTYQLGGEVCERAIHAALRIGYRAIDSATGYKNEELIGEAIRGTDVPREDIFITSKLAPADQGEENAYNAVRTSLERFRMSYLDLYIIHWPGTRKFKPDDPGNLSRRTASWRGLSRAYKEGLVKAIGVSNYTARHLQELLDVCSAEGLPIPAVNQVEFHPLCQQPELLALCRRHDIALSAYTSLGQNSPQLMENEHVLRIAQTHGKAPAQVLLRWAVQQQVPVIPRSGNAERIAQNADVFSFELTDDEMQALASMHADVHFCWNPETVV